MKRRDFMKVAGLTAVALGLPDDMVFTAEEKKAGRPNIILMMTDDQGWSDVSHNEKGALAKGAFKTPELDAMAAAGLRFDRFYAAAPVCSPTRASCLTGRHPFRYGVTTYGRPLKPQEKTIAQALKAAGYRTGHFGKWHLNGRADRAKPIAKDDPLNPGVFGFETWFSAHNTFDLDSTFSRGGTPVATKGDGSDVVVAEALNWIDSLATKAGGQPFFALVWFASPHVPYDPLPADLQAAGGNGKWGELVGVDRAVGTLRRGLRQRGLADNTMLWFNSDNGPTSKSGPLKEQKGSLSEGGVRVPGICEWPARVKPGRTAVPVVTSDFYPTLLEAAGVAMPADKPQPLDGISLIPLLEGRMSERPSPIGFMDARVTVMSDNRYKLMVSGNRTTLYDLIEDMGERKDLSEGKPEVVARMRKILDDWAASVRKSQEGADYPK